MKKGKPIDPEKIRKKIDRAPEEVQTDQALAKWLGLDPGPLLYLIKSDSCVASAHTRFHKRVEDATIQRILNDIK